MELTFEDPPTPSMRSNGRHDHAAISRALEARPGEWALAYENVPSQLAMQIKEGQLIAFRPGGAFQATSRGRDQETLRLKALYVRYVGENGEYA